MRARRAPASGPIYPQRCSARLRPGHRASLPACPHDRPRLRECRPLTHAGRAEAWRWRCDDACEAWTAARYLRRASAQRMREAKGARAPCRYPFLAIVLRLMRLGHRRRAPPGAEAKKQGPGQDSADRGARVRRVSKTFVCCTNVRVARRAPIVARVWVVSCSTLYARDN